MKYNNASLVIEIQFNEGVDSNTYYNLESRLDRWLNELKKSYDISSHTIDEEYSEDDEDYDECDYCFNCEDCGELRCGENGDYRCNYCDVGDCCQLFCSHVYCDWNCCLECCIKQNCACQSKEAKNRASKNSGVFEYIDSGS